MTTRRDIVVVGASAGGVKALQELFGALPAHFPGLVVAVLHRGALHSTGLARVLGRHAPLELSEPESGVRVAPGAIYLAPRDQHLVFQDGWLRPSRGAKEHFTRPAIDPLFRSASEVYGPRVVGVLLTGGGSDGVSGLIAIKERGGVSVVQDPNEAEAPTLPLNAVCHDHVDLILALKDIGPALVQLASGHGVAAPLPS